MLRRGGPRACWLRCRPMPDLSSTPSLWGRLPPVAGELAAALSDLAPVLVGEELPAESASQSFFRVRERELSDQQAALHGVLVVHRGLEDLCDAPPSGPDLALEVTGMRQSVLDPTGAAPGANHDSVPPLAVPEAGAGSSSESVRSARWVIGHQVHALFNVCAAVAVADAPLSAGRRGRCRTAAAGRCDGVCAWIPGGDGPRQYDPGRLLHGRLGGPSATAAP